MTTTVAPPIVAALHTIASAASCVSVSTSKEWTTFHLRLADAPRFRSVGFNDDAERPATGDEADQLLGWLFDFARAEGLVCSIEGGGKIGHHDVRLLRETPSGPVRMVGAGVHDDLATALALALAETIRQSGTDDSKAR